METLKRVFCLVFVSAVVLLVSFPPPPVLAGDIVHDDNASPKKPGCENNFVLVKIQTWVNGIETDEFVGVGARFGTTMESKEKHANHTKLALSDPPDCCSTPKNKLTGEVILVHRGNCKFTTKANVAQTAGASAILIINYHKDNVGSLTSMCMVRWAYKKDLQFADDTIFFLPNDPDKIFFLRSLPMCFEMVSVLHNYLDNDKISSNTSSSLNGGVGSSPYA